MSEQRLLDELDALGEFDRLSYEQRHEKRENFDAFFESFAANRRDELAREMRWSGPAVAASVAVGFVAPFLLASALELFEAGALPGEQPLFAAAFALLSLASAFASSVVPLRRHRERAQAQLVYNLLRDARFEQPRVAARAET